MTVAASSEKTPNAERRTPNVETETDADFCRAMLLQVSRTFAACIGLLPKRIEYPVLIAYLLCRIADTCEDTADLPLARKEALLAHVSACLNEGGPDAAPLAEAFAQARTPDETLTRDADRTLREFRALSPAERAAIRPWVQEMCRGMADFARAHPAAQPGSVDALDSEADLDRYCYYVAGTVGHLLTALFRLHHRISDAKAAVLEQHATSFGLGLQLVNIIKDVADDRQRGWMFVPRQWCAEAGTAPEHFLDSAHAAAAQTVMARMIAKAERHLGDALTYCCVLPRTAYGSRLFCLTPLYFAVRTLAVAAADARLLDPTHKVKITRPEVYRIIAMSRVIAPSNGLVRAYCRHLAFKNPRISRRNP